MFARRVAALVVGLALAAGISGNAQAYNAPGPRWPGTTIHYYDTLPKSYDWSLREATKAWNRAGVRVRLRHVNSRGKAQVVVGFGDTHGYAGYASIGRQSNAYVHLTRGSVTAQNRADTARLIAHEFGHVLGLDHAKPGGCKLMEAAWPSDCKKPRQPWSYNCRWLARDDIRGAVKLYGGKPRLSKLFCLYEPKPPQLRDVRFSGGQSTDSPVQITWTAPPGLRPGALVAIGVYEASRCSGNGDAEQFDASSVAAKAGRWTDDTYTAEQNGEFCYEVRVLNKWGLGAAPIRQQVSRAAIPPAVPVIGSMVEYPDDYYDYLVNAALPENTELHVDAAASGQCDTAYDDSRWSIADALGGNQWGLYDVPIGSVCLSFYAVDWNGVASAPVTREVVHTPRP